MLTQKRRAKIINHILNDMREIQTSNSYMFASGDDTADETIFTHFIWYSEQESWVMLNDDKTFSWVDKGDLEDALDKLTDEQLQVYAEMEEI